MVVNTRRNSVRAIRTVNGDICATLHAEMAAIPKLREGDTLYVLRFRADGSEANSRPCEHCQRMLRRMTRNVEILYTTGDPTNPWARWKDGR